jgi:hypothetical protein
MERHKAGKTKRQRVGGIRNYSQYEFFFAMQDAAKGIHLNERFLWLYLRSKLPHVSRSKLRVRFQRKKKRKEQRRGPRRRCKR